MTVNKSPLVLLALSAVVACVSQLNAQRSRIENEHFRGKPTPMHRVHPAGISTRVAQGFQQSRSTQPGSTFPPNASPASNQVKTLATNIRGFGVPFNINADNATFIEVQLFLSRDQGKSWKFQMRQSTDGRDFPFQATEDGEYWFALKTLNHDRKLLPDGVPQPELKIIVDTVKPTLDFRIETDAAGRVVCRWRAQDDNLAPESLQIYYQPITLTGQAKSWIQVPVNLGGTARSGVYADQIAWWPDTTEQRLNVAMKISDVAGNVVQLDRQVVVPPTAWRKRSQSTALITDAPRPTGSSLSNPWTTPGLKSASANHSPPVPAKQTGKTMQHPPNAVCKDGVCTVIPGPERLAKRLDPTVIQSGTSGSANKPMKLVGSEVEFVAPPVPQNYAGKKQKADTFDPPVAPERVAQAPAIPPPPANTDSITWQSQTESSGPKNNSSSSTTRQPDSSIAPHPFPERPTPNPVTTVPSNPATTVFKGDQVVSQSTTMGPHNQYRGLNSQPDRKILRPELLPQFSANDRISGNGLPTNRQPDPRRAGDGNQPVPEQDQVFSKNSSSKNSEFSNAGFKNNVPSQLSSTNRGQTGELPNRETRAPFQIIGTKRFRLNYGIDSIDPSGVARVDLWMTQDDGQTWNAWGSDPDNQSPFPVEIQEQGRYGFRIVVHSKDGLTGQGPSSGDDADMWVLVDTQVPLTRIVSVPYGREDEAGRLVINYSVVDNFLTLRPITLGYSFSPDGPWTVIEDGLRNEGRYVWKVQPNVPQHVFLRIEAIDKAGNVGIHVLNQSIDVSGLVPRGTIHGVIPVDTSR